MTLRTMYPLSWLRHGGVMLPMYQSEALTSDPQDYMVTPTQPWLDGYCVEKGYIRQFVAMPLGAGYTAEEQLTGEADFGGIQVIVYPMKAEVWERHHSSRCFVHIANSLAWRAITGKNPPTTPATAKAYSLT